MMHTLRVELEVPADMVCDPQAHPEVLARLWDLAASRLEEQLRDNDVTRACTHAGLTVEQLVDPARKEGEDAVKAAVAYRWLHDHGWGWPQIGRLVSRDHTTVLKQADRHAPGGKTSPLSGLCESCGAPSLAGGRWCYRHFRDFVVRERRERERRGRRAGRASGVAERNRRAAA
jgi:hypothetical protein